MNINLPFWLLLFSLVLASAPAKADSCGRLDEGSRFEDINKILDCMEEKINKSSAATGSKTVGFISKYEVKAENQMQSGDFFFGSQGCERTRKYFECRVVVRNDAEVPIEISVQPKWGSVVGENGDTYRAERITLGGDNTHAQSNETLLPGEGSNLLFQFEGIPDDFRSAALKVTLSNKTDRADVHAFVKSPFID